MQHKILALDSAGAPSRWIDLERALYYYAKDLVAWSAGASEVICRGGTSSKTGMRSQIAANSIIAVKGKDFMVRNYDRVPAVSKEMLLMRDRHLCAYCGGQFKAAELDAEHVYPDSRGGAYSWMNLVSACKICNNRKAARTPEEAGMPLLYLPYVPNRHEVFILANRNIKADQMEFLLSGVPKHSRQL